MVKRDGLRVMVMGSPNPKVTAEPITMTLSPSRLTMTVLRVRVMGLPSWLSVMG